jgi:uncharacterized ferritin-like protein (DUF455 family)
VTPDWSPFKVCTRGERGDPPRGITTAEGIGDRLRTAAFAEIQAREAFLYGAERFTEAPEGLKTAWRGLALAEQRHLDWLLKRMQELGVDPAGRAVSDQLWVSLTSCTDAEDFAHYMASAEERGRKAGVRFQQALAEIDTESARIFGKIAEEEVEHIRLADRYYQRPEGAVYR